MAEFIDQLKDKDGNLTNPKTIVAAIKDAAEQLLLNGGDQLSIKGRKNFIEGLQFEGTDVLTEAFLTPEAAIDIQGINTSGIYTYDSKTKNIPFMNQTENLDGYLFAIFRDKNNGVVFFIGSDLYIEKFNGSWRKFFGPQPILLWSGNAKPGDKLTLRDVTTNYRYLRFTVRHYNNAQPLTLCSDQGSFYLTTVGLTTSGKGLFVDEDHLTKGTDNKTLTFVDRKLTNTENGTVTVKTDACIQSIEGIR